MSDTVVQFFRGQVSNLKCLSLNVNGHIDKLEKEDFSALLCKHDIISLGEIKSLYQEKTIGVE